MACGVRRGKEVTKGNHRASALGPDTEPEEDGRPFVARSRGLLARTTSRPS